MKKRNKAKDSLELMMLKLAIIKLIFNKNFIFKPSMKQNILQDEAC